VIEGRLVIPARCLAPYTTHHLFHLWLLSVGELGHPLAKKPNSKKRIISLCKRKTKEKQKKNKRKTKEKQKKNKRKTKEKQKKNKRKTK
jgi:hypothetical protein